MRKRVVILSGDSATLSYVSESLSHECEVSRVVIENSVPRSVFLRRRIAKCGLVNVLGQMLFAKGVAPILAWEARSRTTEIKARCGFSGTAVDLTRVTRVSSVNDPSVPAVIAEASPDYVVVWGTRILSKSLIEKIPVPIINIHVGITPMYRGSHGGYWALYNNDGEHCGVTVHLIDEGIDTGGVLAQETIAVTDADNFATYPLLQLSKGLELLASIIRDDRLEPRAVSGPFSKIWYHPTVWQYVTARMFRGVK